LSDPFGLKPSIRTVDDYPVCGIQFRDITGLLETPDAFATACKEMTALSRAFAPTAVVAIDSRGFVFAGPIARDLAVPLVLARKPEKLPNPTYRKSFDLEYGSASLEIQKNTPVSAKDKVVVVDDLIATGGTAVACAELLSEHFAVLRANILIVSLIDLPTLGGSQIIHERGFNVASLMTYP